MRKKGFLLLSLAVIIAFLVLFAFFQNKDTETRTDLVPVTIKNARVYAEIAADSNEQQRGLSGRDSLDSDRGMLFIFEAPGNHSFWMKDMKFPIDIIWINDNTIVHIEETVQPPKSETETLPIYTPETIADTVLEVNAGWVKENNVAVGDTVDFRR